MRKNVSIKSKQQGAALIVALVALTGVTLLGIANARNSQFLMQSSVSFAKFVETDVQADDAVSCVYHRLKYGREDLTTWISDIQKQNSAPGSARTEAGLDSETGQKSDRDLNEAAASKTTSGGCLTNGAAVAGAPSGVGNDEYSTAQSFITTSGNTSVKDISYYCGYVSTEGSDLGTFVNYLVATAGDAQVNIKGGTKAINVTAWEAFGAASPDLYDDTNDGYKITYAREHDVICEV